jgi:preprotein translocase subunit SecG
MREVLVKNSKSLIRFGIVTFTFFMLCTLLLLATVNTLASHQENPSNPKIEETSTRQPGLPIVIISLIETNKTAQVGPGETGVVHFYGRVNATINPLVTIKVSLSVTDTWGSAIVSPSSIEFTSSGEQEFGIGLRVRPRESCNTVGKVTVTGRWTMYPGDLSGSAEPKEGVDGNIFVAQFYQFSIHPENDNSREEKPGAEIEFEFSVENKGNGIDSFSIEIINLDELSDNNIDASLSETSIVIQSKETRFIKLYVELPSDMESFGDHNIKVKVTSDNGIIKGIAPQKLTFHVEIPEESFTETTEFSIIIPSIIIACALIVIILLLRRKKKRDEYRVD